MKPDSRSKAFAARWLLIFVGAITVGVAVSAIELGLRAASLLGGH